MYTLKQDGRMIYKNRRIGTITAVAASPPTPEDSYVVSDIRGKNAVYKTKDDALYHFTRFLSWDNYAKKEQYTPSRTVRKDVEIRQRFAQT